MVNYLDYNTYTPDNVNKVLSDAGFGVTDAARPGNFVGPIAQGSSYPGNFVGPTAVATSSSARTATNQNLRSLTMTESALSPEQSAGNLSQVYQSRTDLQGLYNPDGTAKNPNDPRVAGIPTLADWASKYGSAEEPLLRGFASSPAVNAMLMQVNQGLSAMTRSGAPVGPKTGQLVSDINNLTNSELEATANARTAADEQDYRSLDGYMKELAAIRKNRDSLVSELLKNVQKSKEELDLSKRLGDLDSEARKTKLDYKEAFNKIQDQPIAMGFIRGQQESALRAANLQLERIAAEAQPVINRLSLAQETRQTAIQTLQIGLQALDQDSSMVTQLASFANELEKTQREEMKAARDFAFEHPEIKTPWYNLNGTVYKTDGTRVYSNPETLFTDMGVKSFEEAYQKGLLMDVKPTSDDEWKLQDVNGVSSWVNAKTREIIPVTGDGVPTNPELEKWRNTPLSAEDLQKVPGATPGMTWGDVQDQGLAVTGKPDQNQFSAARYAARIQDAINNTFRETFKLFEPGGMYSGALGSFNYGEDKLKPNFAKPAQFKQHQQAAENFVNAINRKESGANITEAEWDRAYAQYLPKPGDDAKTIEQKKRNMNTVLASLIAEAGAAWQQQQGQSLFQEFENGGSGVQPTGMRTDRHNNPTAFTTDIARLAGLHEGVDYVPGDTFSNGRYRTARLLQDPIATTIKVIDRIGFKTSSGANRWTYTDSIPQTKNWRRLTYAQKAQVIREMYRHEGGTQLSGLFNTYA